MHHYVYKMLAYKHEMIEGDDLFLIPTKNMLMVMDFFMTSFNESKIISDSLHVKKQNLGGNI